MIVAELKPLKEIIAAVSGYKRILIVGCGSCVTVCLSGGDREAQILKHELSYSRHYRDQAPVFETSTLIRQCELDLITNYFKKDADFDAVLSLACGAGVQVMAGAFEPLPVIPALNTTFLGASLEPGTWQEMCQGCGDCVLAVTGGVCPVTRCSKGLDNGPCGGSQDGRCEVDQELVCGWVLIYNRLKNMNKLHLMQEIRPPKDWRSAGGAGPRIRKRTGIAGSPGI